MNLLAMRGELRPKIGNPTVAEVPDLTLTRLLNAGYSFITERYAFNETRCVKTFPTVAAVDRYTVPPDLAALFRIWNDTEKYKLTKRGIRFLATARKNVPNGKPKHYIRIKDFFQLYPVPDAVYTMEIFYLQAVAALVADADTPVIPATWHQGIVLKARHIYYDERGDVGKAIYAKNEWKDWVSDKPSEIDLEKDDLEDSGVIVASLGSEHNRYMGGRSDYDHYPSRFDTED